MSNVLVSIMMDLKKHLFLVILKYALVVTFRMTNNSIKAYGSLNAVSNSMTGVRARRETFLSTISNCQRLSFYHVFSPCFYSYGPKNLRLHPPDTSRLASYANGI